MVFYIFALCIFAAPQVWADEQADIVACLELFKPENIEKDCCQSMQQQMHVGFESCKTKNNDWDCSNSKCFLDKLGLLTGETLDEKKTMDMIEKMKSEHPEQISMAERVEKQCLDGKYADYPPKEACPLIKFQICTYINSIVECPSWKGDDTCKKMSDNAKTCKSTLDNMKK